MDNSSDCSPHDPWYYREDPPPPVEEIEPADTPVYILPKSRKKLEAKLEKAQADLQRDIERYLDLAQNGEAALSASDRMYGYLNASLSLKYSHISYQRGLIAAIKKALGAEQCALF